MGSFPLETEPMAFNTLPALPYTEVVGLLKSSQVSVRLLSEI